eukprot:s1115_g19.t1
MGRTWPEIWTLDEFAGVEDSGGGMEDSEAGGAGGGMSSGRPEVVRVETTRRRLCRRSGAMTGDGGWTGCGAGSAAVEGSRGAEGVVMMLGGAVSPVGGGDVEAGRGL